MSKKRSFPAISEEKQQHYERMARLQYDPEVVRESTRRWKSYSEAQKQAIGAEGSAVYSDLVDALEAGTSPQNAEVQAIFERWHKHLTYFYEPTLEILRGLGELYETEPDFVANFQKLHPDLPAYLREGITHYVDALEHAAIIRLLSEDEDADAASSE